MAEPTGLEPAPREAVTSPQDGPDESPPGHNEPKLGQPQEVASGPECKSRTASRHEADESGHLPSTTRAQLPTTRPHEHGSTRDGLDEVMNAWRELPEAVRTAITAMVRSVRRPTNY
jgi:hypothetical protein